MTHAAPKERCATQLRVVRRRNTFGRTLSGYPGSPTQYRVTPTLRPLRGYEPTDDDVLERWTTPRPLTAPQLTLDTETPDDAQLRTILTKVLEVLDGRRHIAQLRALLTGPVYEATLTRLRTMPPATRYQLYSVHTCWPNQDVVEMTGRLETLRPGYRRAQALAARMERREGVWMCVFLRILEGRQPQPGG